MARITDAQLGVLHALSEHGPKQAVEVLGPPDMAGKRKPKLECHLLNIATLRALTVAGLVKVTHGNVTRPVDATGRKGNPRRAVTIEITDAGRAALGTH